MTDAGIGTFEFITRVPASSVGRISNWRPGPRHFFRAEQTWADKLMFFSLPIDLRTLHRRSSRNREIRISSTRACSNSVI